MSPDTPLMVLFASALGWVDDTYPDKHPTELVIRFHDGRSVRLLFPAAAFGGDEDGDGGGGPRGLGPVEEVVLQYLRGQKGRLTAKEVRDGLERQKEVHGLSTIERALARLNARGLVRNIHGQGYAVTV